MTQDIATKSELLPDHFDFPIRIYGKNFASELGKPLIQIILDFDLARFACFRNGSGDPHNSIGQVDQLQMLGQLL